VDDAALAIGRLNPGFHPGDDQHGLGRIEILMRC